MAAAAEEEEEGEEEERRRRIEREEKGIREWIELGAARGKTWKKEAEETTKKEGVIQPTGGEEARTGWNSGETGK